MISRRHFLAAGAAAALASQRFAVAAPTGRQAAPLAREVGVTMSSFARLATDAGPERITMLEWPRILRDELDMRVIDLNSGVITSLEPAYLDNVRKAVDDAGSILTNIKINRSDIDFSSRDDAVRGKALAECKRWIEASGRLGLRWVRALPFKNRPPDMGQFIAAYRELADYAADHDVRMVVENYGWMSSDAEAVPKLIEAVGPGLAAAPDTGNWDKDIRYLGLEKMFPLAVTCDFKAGKLGPNGEHSSWDLKRCFTIGWKAGFRGPWCLEHAGTDRAALFRELALLRDMLRGWMAEPSH